MWTSKLTVGVYVGDYVYVARKETKLLPSSSDESSDCPTISRVWDLRLEVRRAWLSHLDNVVEIHITLSCVCDSWLCKWQFYFAKTYIFLSF